MLFEFSATIDSSYLTTSNDPLAPEGSTLYGTFSYNQDAFVQFGPAYYFDPGAADLSVYTDEGFELMLDNRVTNVAPGDTTDSFSVQSFVSEDPNGWHIVLDLLAPDFLGGSTDLPTEFPDSFDDAYVSVYFTDEFDWVRVIDATITSIGPAEAQPIPFAETGTVSMNHKSTTITLAHTYDNPVVIAFVATENGAQPVNARVSEVSGNTLTMRLQEPEYLDGRHVFETVNYIVVEAGVWTLEDGTIFEAGHLNTDTLSGQGFETVEFQSDFDESPLVFSQVQTYNGPDFVTTRQRDTSEDGFQVTLQEEEALNGGQHNTETIGWLALEAGSGTSGDLSWWAGQVSGVNHTNTELPPTDGFDGDINAIAMLSSFAGSDTAWVRGDDDVGGFEFSVEEEKSRDSEVLHLPELVDVLVFDTAGTLSGFEADLIL